MTATMNRVRPERSALANNGMTACLTESCREPGYVILYASAYRFCGLETFPGQQLGFCLRHGGDLYDAIRAWRDRRSVAAPTWLVDDLKANRLPRITPRVEGWARQASERERRWKPDEFAEAQSLPAKPRQRSRRP